MGRRASPEWVALSQTLETAVGPTCLAPRPWWADAPRLGWVSLCRSFGIRVDSWAGRRARPPLLVGRRASPEWVALSQALETAVGPTCLGLRPWWADAPHLGLVSLCRSLGIRVDSWAGRRARPSLLAGADVLRLGLVSLSQILETARRQLGGPTCLALRSWWADAPRLGWVSLCRSFENRADSWAGRRAPPTNKRKVKLDF